jgi:ABC-type cobalamin/Fe3+-siderophores transport system ATPase subunit
MTGVVLARVDAKVDLEVLGLGLNAGGAATSRRLFADLSFRVEAGQRWVVIGPNGSGKSSLLAAIAGVFPIADGEVRFEAKRLSDWRADALADRRAWSPQFWSDPFPATVAETAALARERGLAWHASGGRCDDPEIDATLARLDLLRFADVDVRSLSGGERQRVAIATALLQDAPLLLLDEPASHLDLSHQRLLVEVLLRHAAQGGAVIASLHSLDIAWDLASHCIVLDGQGGADAGPRDEILGADRLASVFGVAIEAIELRGARRFVIGAAEPARDA